MLPNGLQVVTEDIRSTSTYSLGVFVSVGSRHETPSLHGASHFLEHLLFKGTPSRTAEQISAAIESVGGELNAYTAKEHTCFYARVLHSDAELVVDVLTDMITNSLITGRRRRRRAGGDLGRDLHARRRSGRAGGRGSRRRNLRQVGTRSPGDRIGSLGRQLSPGGRSCSTGAVTTVPAPWSSRPLARSIMIGSWSGSALLTYRLSQSAAVSTRADHDQSSRRADHAPLAARAIQRGAGLPQPWHLRHYAAMRLALLSLIIGGGMASRLFVEVRERRGLSYGIDAGETAYSDAGLWSVEWQCAPGKLAADSGTGAVNAYRGCRPRRYRRGAGASQGSDARPDGALLRRPRQPDEPPWRQCGARRRADPGRAAAAASTR